MSEENKNTAPNEGEAAPPEARTPPPYPYPFPYPYAMPQGAEMPAGQGQMPYSPYPMFIPVPMFMPPYGMPTALPPQGGANAPTPLNSYERQAGMQVVYQDGTEQAPGMSGGYPFYPQMMLPQMMPYGYPGYGQPPFPGYGQPQQAPKAPYEADVQVLYQAVDEGDEDHSGIQAGTPVPVARAAAPVSTGDIPPETQGDSVGSLRDLFEEAGVTVTAAAAEYSEEELAEMFEEPGQRRSFKHQFRDLFPRRSDSTGEVVRKSAFLTSVLAILITAPILLNSFFIGPTLERRALNDVQTIIMSTQLPMSQLAAQYENIIFPANMQSKYAAVYAKNQDTRGWLTINSLNINYPVMQAADNTYYLKHAFDKTTNKHGVPFFDKNTRLQPNAMSKNIVVYGHNNAYVDLVFHNLIKYENVKQWQAEPTIKLDTIYGEYLWKIYAVFYTNGVEHTPGEYMFPFYWSEMKNGQNFMNYIHEVDRRALYSTGVDIKEDDRILTLSTCAFNFDGSHFIILARQVRPGENPNPDISKVVVNSDPQYPAYYYAKKKKVNHYTEIPDWQYSPDM
ncbi:MAG: sortase [Oscillospiraceae bacterium]|nr:sortase [Oscillospiraceae bacterium]